jgi:hypothetical protein
MSNPHIHTALDQLAVDLHMAENYEALAQDASADLNDLMGDEAFDAWKDMVRAAWQSMSWKQVYEQVERKIKTLNELAAYMARYNVDHEPVTNLVMEVD